MCKADHTYLSLAPEICSQIIAGSRRNQGVRWRREEPHQERMERGIAKKPCAQMLGDVPKVAWLSVAEMGMESTLLLWCSAPAALLPSQPLAEQQGDSLRHNPSPLPADWWGGFW